MAREWDKESGTWKGSRASVTHDNIPNPLWVFGYGSLCWKPGDGLPHVEKRVATLHRYKRRFFQLSADHRGTPANPGLVVTLVPSSSNKDEVVGIAYRVDPARAASVIDTLDFREKGGYTRANVPISLVETHNGADMHDGQESVSETVQALVYYADESNPNYAKKEVRESDESIARIIASAQGPSGSNTEYLFKLVEFSRTIGIADTHLDSLESKVNAILKTSLPEETKRA